MLRINLHEILQYKNFGICEFFEIQATFGHLFGQYVSGTFRDSETEMTIYAL